MELAELKDIKGMSEGSIELLAAAGVEDFVPLAQSDSEDLFEEMEQAKAHLKLDDAVPDQELIKFWIKTAQEITEKKSATSAVRLEEESEDTSLSILEAMPVKKDYIIKHEIAVVDVPVMEEFVSETNLQEIVQERPVAVNKAPVARERTVIEPLEGLGRLDLRKSATSDLNAGKKIHSRRYIRGVLHPQKIRVRIASLVTLITLMLLPASFVVAGLVLLGFSKWFLLIPGSFFLFGLLYLMIAKTLKCRVCGQTLYSQMLCRRHVKAHYIPVLGYIFATCLHALFFHWFRCIYCGTSVRLKE
jgi:hypothetical protein